jgi:hypothetical protein
VSARAREEGRDAVVKADAHKYRDVAHPGRRPGAMGLRELMARNLAGRDHGQHISGARLAVASYDGGPTGAPGNGWRLAN